MQFSQPSDTDRNVATQASPQQGVALPTYQSDGARPPSADEPKGALQLIWGAWLRLTAPSLQGRELEAPSTHMLERRRSLAASLLFGLVFLWTVLTPIDFALYSHDLRGTFTVVAIGYLTLFSVGWLIRRGWVTSAAVVLTALILIGFLAIQLSESNGALERATAFYILLYPILLAATLMPAEALFVTLAANLLLVGWSALVIWPASIRLESLSASQFTNVYVWPIVTLIIVTIVAYIWTSGMQRAAEQAEFAKLNEMLLRTSESDARRALEHDAQELIRVIDSWSSNNLGAQTGPLANGDLRRVAIALSSYASRVRTLAKDQFELQREREAVRRVAEAILYARQGMPVTWPVSSGLPADIVIHAITTQDPQSALAELNLIHH